MARKCSLTGKNAQSGNNVSHSKRKTRRTFGVNVQNVSLFSEALKQTISIKIAACTLRTIEHNGGFDAFLLKTSNLNLSAEAVSLKKKVKKALEQKASA